MTGAGSTALNWTFAVAGGTSVIAAFLTAIVFGLRPDDRWDARYNAHGKPTRSGWPVVILVILSLLAGARREQVVRFITGHHRAIEIVGGLLLVGVGLWDLAVNLDNLRRTFGF